MNYSPRFGVTVLATTLGFAALSTFAPTTAQAQTTLLSQGFEDVTTLAGLGYAFQNNSTTPRIGTLGGGYSQGNAANFVAQSGATNSFIGNNYTSTGSTATSGATISDFFITPTLSLQNGDTISFYTRTITGGSFPDRLELRLSTAGTSTNVGTTTTSVGDFATLLVSVNPTLLTGTGYPNTFTQFSATLTGIAPGTTGRYAFRYFVTDAGTNGLNSDYIGIDTLSVVRPAAAAAPEPGSVALLGLGMIGGVAVLRRRK